MFKKLQTENTGKHMCVMILVFFKIGSFTDWMDTS